MSIARSISAQQDRRGPQASTSLVGDLAQLLTQTGIIVPQGTVTHAPVIRINSTARPILLESQPQICAIGADGGTEPMIIELARGTLTSGEGDAALPLSPVGLMIKLRSMFDAAGSLAWRTRIGYYVPERRFHGKGG